MESRSRMRGLKESFLMFRAVRELWKDEWGVASVEYALLLVLVVVGSIGAWSALSDSLTSVLENVVDALDE